MTGSFVVLEGGEGTGKSSLVPRIARRFRSLGIEAVETREPGGTDIGRELRTLLLDGGDVDPHTEALLMAADRSAHVHRLIRPALERDAVVVSDRFLPSSLVYQGVARGLGVDAIATINDFGIAGCVPDLIVVLDVDDSTSDARRSREADRLEREPDAFHRTVRSSYRELAAQFGWEIVDATPALDDVEAAVWSVIEARLALGAS